VSAADKYNGWANYQTWNVILWMDNDEKLHDTARKVSSYKDFREAISFLYSEFYDNTQGHLYYPMAFETPDNVAWNDSAICMEEVDNWFRLLQKLSTGVLVNYKARKQAEGAKEKDDS